MKIASVDKYVKTEIKPVIEINNIVTIHYFEFACDYVFSGEHHDFWEFLYVDKGEVEVLADTKAYKLTQSDIIFHKPNEFHSVCANGKVAPNIIVISFDCNNVAMDFFNNKILKVELAEKDLLAQVIKCSKDVYGNSLGFHNKLEKKDNPIFGSEQLIKIYLELFLINLMQKCSVEQNDKRLSINTLEKMELDLIDNIVTYMHKNLHEDLTFDNICSTFNLGKTHLKMLFKTRMNTGVMTYYKQLKVEEAKRLIREHRDNFTTIAYTLGYKSVHSFSRSFKDIVNMTPTEYSISVMSRANLR